MWFGDLSIYSAPKALLQIQILHLEQNSNTKTLNES